MKLAVAKIVSKLLNIEQKQRSMWTSCRRKFITGDESWAYDYWFGNQSPIISMEVLRRVKTKKKAPQVRSNVNI